MERFKLQSTLNPFGYVIGKISVPLSSLLLSQTQTVIFSQASLEKNLNNHKDLLPEDYLKLNDIVGRGHFMAQDGEKTVAIVLEQSVLYHYALKCTQSGEALFLTSFRKTNMNDVTRIRKKGEKGKVIILKDTLP